MKKISLFRGNYSSFSNFSDHAVIYEGISYANSEAAFQASKFLDIEIRKLFSDLSGVQARKKGKSRSLPLRSDWENVKDSIMYDIVRQKFLQNTDALSVLLSTGDAIIAEGNTWGDRYWGEVNGVGENKLGKILMRLRAELLDFNTNSKK